jgi:hypothetical protein
MKKKKNINILKIQGLYDLEQNLLDKYPILKYRIENFKNGVDVRGIKKNDSNRCAIVLDDSVIAGDFHYSCVINMREGGKPIGKVGPKMREERKIWFETHDTHKDPICKKSCLDVCIFYNNKYRDLHK